jgi:hypothetical protein
MSDENASPTPMNVKAMSRPDLRSIIFMAQR